MKKTLQIMMVAASALLGAVSCGGGGGNGTNANAAVQPISPSDFAQGKKGYEMTIKGVRCQLRGQDGIATDTTANLERGFWFIYGDGGSYLCRVTYQLNAPIAENPMSAELTIVFDKDSFDEIKEDLYFKKFWGITDVSKMEATDEYSLTLSFSNARVEAKSQSGGQDGLLETVTFTSPDGAAGDATGA